MIGDKLSALYNFANSSEYPGYEELVKLGRSLKSDPSMVISSDELTYYDQRYSEIIKSHDSELPRLQTLCNDADVSIKALTAQYAKLSEELGERQKLLAFYNSLLEETSAYYLESLAAMLTEVYQKVYEDMSSRVLLEMQDSRGRKVIKLRIIKTIDGTDYTEELKAQGGSCKNILGIMIQVYVIINLGLPRVIFIDETLSSLSNKVLANLLTIFESLRDELSFNFVIIDHAIMRFQGFIDNLFVIERGLYRQVLDINKFIYDIESSVEERIE